MEQTEVIKYENTLNRIPLSGLNGEDLDIFMYICSQVRDNGDTLLKLRYADIKRSIGREKYKNEYFTEVLRNISKKLLAINVCFSDNYAFEQFNLFVTFKASVEPYQDSRFGGDVEGCTLIVRVNPDYIALFNELNIRFTAFELKEYVQLDSKYTKNLYRLLKQWRTQGKTQSYKVEELRTLMDCPENYQQKYFMRDMINPAVKELNDKGIFKSLVIVCERDQNKRGRPVRSYSFTFQQEKQGGAPSTSTGGKKKPAQNKFNNFTQREYTPEDFGDFERRAMGVE